MSVDVEGTGVALCWNLILIVLIVWKCREEFVGSVHYCIIRNCRILLVTSNENFYR